MTAENLGNDEKREVVQTIFVLMRTVMAHGHHHPLSSEMAQRAVIALKKNAFPLTIQMIRGGVFFEQKLLTLSWELYQRALALSAALNNINIHEITFAGIPTRETMLEMGIWLARGAQGVHEGAELARLENVAWRSIIHAAWGEEQEEIDQNLYALSQTALAIEEASQLDNAADEPWNWSKGLSIIRRLNSAYDANPNACIRALEMAPGGWSPSRRAVSAAFDVLACLKEIETNSLVYRAAAHAALGLGIMGFFSRGGVGLEDSAPALLYRMLESPVLARTGIPPHRLRVTTIVETMANKTPDRWMSFMFLIQLAYELEQERCPADVTFSLTRTDLLALAAQDMGTIHPPAWVRTLINLHGEAPPGAYVQLANGDVGVILSDNQDATFSVLSDGRILNVPSPVKIVSAFQAHHM